MMLSMSAGCGFMRDSERIGQTLRNLRNRLGLTAKEVSISLADKGIDASLEAIYAWERGTRRMGADAFLSLCELYGVADVMLETVRCANQRPHGYGVFAWWS